MKTILLLDDDPYHLDQLSQVLCTNGYETVPCLNVAAAMSAIGERAIDFAIVDLFLEGNEGDELSNEFIELVLTPASIKYGRMSSAPGMVPKEYAGDWIIDKRAFRRDPSETLQALAKSLY